MNYLVAVDTFFPDRPTGSARVAWDIAMIMRDIGHNVWFFCRKQKADSKEIENFQGINVVRFAFPSTFALNPFKVKKQIKAGINIARKHLLKITWDIVHIHSDTQGNVIYDLLGDKTKYVYTVHSPVLLELKANWAAEGIKGKIKWVLGKSMAKYYEGRLLKAAAKIHTLSQYTKSKVEEFYGFGDKTTVIPHWCRQDFFRKNSKDDARRILKWPSKAKILFTVRRLAPRMGLDVAIKAIAPLLKSNSDLFFALIGAGSLESELKKLTNYLGVDSKIWFLGRVDDEFLKRCYEAADLFIMPTASLECFGLPILEAFAYGLPIISSDAAAIPELMLPIIPDAIVPAGNIIKLRDKVKSYLNGNLILPSSEALIKYVTDDFAEETIVSKIISWIEK